MARKRSDRPRAEPGDTRLEDVAFRDERDQPLSQDEKDLVGRAYELFEHFRQKLQPEHMAMWDARKMRQKTQDERAMTAPASNALGSCMDNVIADQIDNMPEAVMLPEREEAMNQAEEMSDVVSYVLYQAGWPRTYQTLMEDSIVTGTGIAEVFWDDDMENGEGMANVLAWHPEDFYPDPMYEDIQDGRGCFKVTHTTVAWVEEHYPHAKGYVRGDEYANMGVEAELESPTGDVKTTLIEFWYKRYNAKSRRNHVHMAQFAGKALLFSTELDFGVEKSGEYREGVFAHGQYPFVMFKYRDVWRKPFGSGLVADYKDTQHAIDRYIKYIDDNARESSIQRHFVQRNAGVNTEDVADMNKRVIEWEGGNIREVIQTIQATPLNGQVYQIMTNLVDNMKQDCGQNQFTRGEGGMGVTAAGAIQALQEAGSKITRWHTERYKFAFKTMVEQLMWVLSEYITPERKIWIVGGWDSTENMKGRSIAISGPPKEGDALPKPAYSVRVQVQRNNPLQIQANNDFLNTVAQVCAQAGTPLPPEAYISMLQGYPTKPGVLKMVQANSQQKALMDQMQATIEQQQAQLDAQSRMNTGMKKALTTTGGGAALAQQAEQPEGQQPMQGA